MQLRQIFRSMRGKIIIWTFIPTVLVMTLVALLSYSAYQQIAQKNSVLAPKIQKMVDRTRDIPVLFLRIVEDEKDKAQTFAVGGVNFISKPFLTEELLARIDTRLTLRRIQIGLEQLVDAQTQELLNKNQQLCAEITERQHVVSIFEHWATPAFKCV